MEIELYCMVKWLSEWKFHTTNCFSVFFVVIDTLQLGSSSVLTNDMFGYVLSVY